MAEDNHFSLQAVRKRDLDTLKNIDNLSQESIEKSMLIAAEKGYFEIFKYLVEKADEEKTQWGDYQEISAKEGHLNIFVYLNENKAEYIYDDWHDFMEYAVIRGDLEMVKYLDHGIIDEYIVLAMNHRHHHIAKYALENGNVRFMDLDEYLMGSLEQGYFDLVEIIVEQLEDIDWNQIYEEFEGDYEENSNKVVRAYIKSKIESNVDK
uniref:Ankyrin repeat protein n=1 Tax=Pithovirus LCPAC401 TaxID=2506595 RepID=A0A481ZCW5_9VIRU|nr:MAG: ankyrin repeat protein [Pithovirus LCPAC401]